MKRLALGPVDKQGRDRFRALCEAAGPGRCGSTRWATCSPAGRARTRPAAGAVRQPPGQPAHGRQVRRRAGRDGRAGGDAEPDDLGIADRGAGGAGELDRRGGQPVRQEPDGLGRVGRGVRPGGDREALADLDGARRSARRWTPSAIAGRSRRRRSRPMRISSCISSRGRSWKREGKQIGIVTGGQAQVWYDAVATGQDSHAGTTPPSTRRDALVCAARVIDLVDRMMRARGEDGRGTVGRWSWCFPNSCNVVPGEVRFSVEFRHPTRRRSAGWRRSSRGKPGSSRGTAGSSWR